MAAAGVPPRTPVEELNVTPEGSAPDSDKVGAGIPVAVTVNEPAEPTVKVVLFTLVIAGGTDEVFTVRLKFWVTLTVPEPAKAAMPAAQGSELMVKAEAAGLVVELS